MAIQAKRRVSKGDTTITPTRRYFFKLKFENAYNSQSHFHTIFAFYDTGTIKGYERPCCGFEEVSLTSLTVRSR